MGCESAKYLHRGHIIRYLLKQAMRVNELPSRGTYYQNQ